MRYGRRGAISRSSASPRCSPAGAAEAAERFAGGLPDAGDGALAALTELVERGIPAATRSAGPRFFHFVTGGVTPAALGGRLARFDARPERVRRRQLAARRAARGVPSRGCWSSSSCPPSGAASSRPARRRPTSPRWRPRGAGGPSGTASTSTTAGSRACRRARSSPSGYIHPSAIKALGDARHRTRVRPHARAGRGRAARRRGARARAAGARRRAGDPDRQRRRREHRRLRSARRGWPTSPSGTAPGCTSTARSGSSRA